MYLFSCDKLPALSNPISYSVSLYHVLARTLTHFLTFCPLLTTFCPLLTTFCPILTTFCPLLTTFCPLLTTFCPLLTTFFHTTLTIYKKENFEEKKIKKEC